MVDENQVWRVENEGNLARTWERRLKPRVQPKVRRRRVAAPWLGTVGWIGAIWTGAIVASALAIHVMTMSYRYDQMNQEYAALVRQDQQLGAVVASMTSAQALTRDAARLKVSVVAPDSNAAAKKLIAVHRRPAANAMSPVQLVTSWIQRLGKSLGQ